MELLKQKNMKKFKKQEGGLLVFLLETLGAIMLGNTLTAKVVLRAGRRYNKIDQNF